MNTIVKLGLQIILPNANGKLANHVMQFIHADVQIETKIKTINVKCVPSPRTTGSLQPLIVLNISRK